MLLRLIASDWTRYVWPVGHVLPVHVALLDSVCVVSNSVYFTKFIRCMIAGAACNVDICCGYWFCV